MFEFIEKLQVSAADKAKLRSLGAASAPALLALIQASEDVVAAFLGPATVRAVKKQLLDGLNPTERQMLAQHEPPTFHMGAMITRPAPDLSPPRYDLRQRDQLYNQVQQLRARPNKSRDVKTKIAELEHQINQMLSR